MSADLLARLIEAGVAADLVADVARLQAREEIAREQLAAAEAAAAERREQVRAGNTERQQRRRARIAVSRDVTPVTRDNALPSVTPPLDKKNPQTPKRINPPLTPIEADASMPPAGAERGQDDQIGKRAKRRATARGASSRLSPDWQPPAIADLPQTVQAMIRNWPAGAYEVTAEAFRNHWTSEGRAIGAKRDWAKTWHNWLMRECTAVARAVKAGVSFSPAAPGKGSLSDEERAARFDRTAELFDKMGRPEDAAQQREQARLVRAHLVPAPA